MNKLSYEQRAEANKLLDNIQDEDKLEGVIYELISLRSRNKKLEETLKDALEIINIAATKPDIISHYSTNKIKQALKENQGEA